LSSERSEEPALVKRTKKDGEDEKRDPQSRQQSWLAYFERSTRASDDFTNNVEKLPVQERVPQ